MLSQDESLIYFTMGSPFFVSLQGELGLPGPPGMDGEKVSEAWLDQVRPCQEPNEKGNSCLWKANPGCQG